MTKPAKQPTIQDLSREELLRLIPLICPFRVDARAIFTAQMEVAWEQHSAMGDVTRQASDACASALARWQDCVNRKAPPGTTAKAQRGYIAAEDAYQAAYRKMERHWRRWERLAALRDRKG